MKNNLFSILVLVSTFCIAQNTFTNNGSNVGIGTTTPEGVLHVKEANSTTNITGAPNPSSLLLLQGLDAGVESLSDNDHYSWGGSFTLGAVNSSGLVDKWGLVRQTSNAGDGSFRITYGTSKYVGDNPLMFLISKNGNIGIGTDVPTAKVDIKNGHLYVGDETFSNPSSWGQTINIDDDVHSRILIEERETGVQTSLWSHKGGNSRVGTISDHDFGIMTKGKERLMVKTNGDIGIGTNSPDSRLTVKGKIHAEEVKVDLSVPGPDYVFKKGYDLLTIEEVKQHIDQKGHLPNIPSALEMEQNGVELGVMNMKLLEKIEELTLYAIAQEQKLTKQESKLKVLEEKLELLLHNK